MIIGVTCTKDGSIIQRLPVATKLAIGLAPSGQRNYPERLDHFVFLKRGQDKSTWVKDERLFAAFAKECNHEIAESCEKCCRVIDIMFLDDDIDSIIPNELAWWSKTEKKCWGDGNTATRKTAEFPHGKAWTPCGPVCPDLKAERCAVSTDLYFVFAAYPDLGSVVRLHTSSARSTQNLFSGIQQIATVTGGRLAGVTVPICVSMEHTSFLREDGKKQSTVVPILSFKTNLNQLVENIGNTAALFSTARKALGVGKIVVDEDEGDKAPEIAPEFHPKALPETTTEPSKTPEVVKPESTKTEARPTADPSGGANGKTSSEVAKSAAPTVEKIKAIFEGIPKNIRELTIAQGPNKGKPFWKFTLEMQAGDGEFLIFSSTVKGKIDDAIKRSQEVQLPCEVRVSEARRAVIVEDVEMLAKPLKSEPETPSEESPDWMLA